MSQSEQALHRARQINSDPNIYGAFAEIGAGQEVARYFFQAGKASQTIAKTISAYDMTYSDEIYGKEKSGRYVCESRLLKMLDKEYSLLIRRLNSQRGEKTNFFAFADTVATGDGKTRYSHGWMGVRFQLKPQSEPNEIILHVRLLDRYRLQQQDTLGQIGVSLVYCAFHCTKNPETFIQNLIADIKEGQIAIDYIKFNGPDLAAFNNQILNLELVRRGLTEAVLFGTEQNVLNIGDELYRKPILVQRGIFKPVTNSHMDALKTATKQFEKDFKKKPMPLFELTMHALTSEGHIHEKDFLDRVRSINALGLQVLVSNFQLFYKLKRFLRTFTQEPVITVLPATHLVHIFEKKYYADLEGGLLEGLSKLMDDNTKLYIYPHKTQDTCSTASTFNLGSDLNHLYQHFRDNGQIQDISDCDQTSDYLHSDAVRKLMEAKDPKWKNCVPAVVLELIEKEKLFLRD